MANEMWSAILNPHGPNYKSWRELLGSECVPLQSPYPIFTELGAESDVEVYKLDMRALTLAQRARLLVAVASKSEVTVATVEAAIAESGFPIRAVDVIVSISLRAVV